MVTKTDTQTAGQQNLSPALSSSNEALFRDHLGVTELAKKLGVDPAHICRILSGKSNPSLALASRMADALGMSLDDLCLELKLRGRTS